MRSRIVRSRASQAVHHLVGAGFAARIGLATVVALTATMCSYWTQTSGRTATAQAAQLVDAGRLQSTDKSDRLDAYVREARAEASGMPNATSDASPLLPWPLAARVTTGIRIGPNGERNYGIRIAVPVGTPVRAAADGVVVFAGNATDGYGKKIVIAHGAIQTVYGHASEILVRTSERVRKGQVIAKSGQSGFATSPRLYLGIVGAGSSVDPIAFFSKAGTLNKCAAGDRICKLRDMPRASAPRPRGVSAPLPVARPVPPADIPFARSLAASF
jgi:murein DD-endopeptidase MepM/ murein hydrolase activator NlpD